MPWDRWTDDHLFKVAWMHYREGLAPDEIGARIGKAPSTVRKMLKRAKEQGIVQIGIVPRIQLKELEHLRHRVRGWFELVDVQLVPGREDLMEDPCPQEKQPEREVLVFSIAQAAARYLEDQLKDRDVLAVPWGRMLSYISRQLQPTRTLPGLVAVPMVGVMGVEADPVGWSFEANTIAAQIAAAFGGRAWQLPAPAVADRPCYKALLRHPLVSRALEKLAEATVAVVPIAPVDPENSTVVRMGLLKKEQVERLKGRGAVGEIASHWWFTQEGEPLTDEGSFPIGLGLEGLRRMVEQNRQVIAVVGASEQRIKPLWVALQQGLVNTLITDHITAERLLELKV
jgi:deoxyribonucleoside regulator